MKPKVSIITVVFNSEDLIEKTIKSVKSQTYQNIEYLIIDGASTDKTLEIIKKYKVDFLLSEPDKNLYDAMNKGIKYASGEYLYFLNAGDIFFENNSLEKMISLSKGEDFLYGRTIFVDRFRRKRHYYKQTPYPDKLSYKSFINGMVISHQAMIVKKNITPQFEVDKWKVSSDIEWSIRFLKDADSKCFLDEPFCLFYDVGHSKQFKNRWLGTYERFKICLIYFGFFPTFFEQFKIIYQYFRYPKKYC